MTPSHAERARTILAANTEATLATVDIDGRPVVSPVPMVADAAGVPVVVVSNLSTHSSRGRRDTRAGMSIGKRLLIQGDLRPVPGIQQIELTDAVCLAHPHLREAVESLDWSWLRLEPTRVRLTDDDGNERWLRPSDVAGAEPDPLVVLGPGFVDEVRAKLADQALLVIKTLGGRWLATDAHVDAIDRYGITLSGIEPAGTRASRVPFPERLDEPSDVHAALGALVLAARAAARRDDVPDNPTEWPDTRSVAEPPAEAEALAPVPVPAATAGGTALIDGLRQAAAQTRLQGIVPDIEEILLSPDELYRSDGVRPWREGDEVPSIDPDDAADFEDQVDDHQT